jgi:ribosomal protein S18 acetylase RimI-like enzyme
VNGVDLAVDSDLPALAALMAASPLLQRYAVGSERALASLRSGVSLGDVVLVTRTGDGSPRGFAWLQHLRGFGAAAYLRLLLVSEAQQRRGVGQQLMADAEERAAAWSRHLLLLTTEDNHAARRFYERLGYQQVGRLPRLILPDADELLYQKTLYTEPR